MLTLFNLARNNEFVPRYWREGLIIILFKKGDREDSGNCRGVTLLNVVGTLYSRIINSHLVKYMYLELNNKLHGQGGFKTSRSCIDNSFAHDELIQLIDSQSHEGM